MNENKRIKVINTLENLKDNIKNIREIIPNKGNFSKYLQNTEFNILFAINELKENK